MQLMPATAERFGVTNAFDPVANIYAGTRYLKWLLKTAKHIRASIPELTASAN